MSSRATTWRIATSGEPATNQVRDDLAHRSTGVVSKVPGERMEIVREIDRRSHLGIVASVHLDASVSAVSMRSQ